MFLRMFPNRRFFGNLDNTEYGYNQTFGVMCREEGLRVTNELARLTLPHERKIDYKQILSYENSKQVKETILKDEQIFMSL